MTNDLTVKLRILASDEGVAGKIARIAAGTVGLGREFERLGERSRSSMSAMRTGMDSVSRQLARLQQAAIVFAGLFQGAGLVGGIAGTAAKFESLEVAMRTVFGSAEAAAAEMARLREESNRLGVPLETLTRGWLGFAAAARGTAIEGQTAQDVFTALTEASVTLGLSQEQLHGALLAMQQMISKVTVSSEELRQQLGERIYGAMQIAARSIGIGTEQLYDFLERGLIPAERFLPAFAAQLRKELGGGVTEASNTARAAFARIENSLLELKLEFARSGFMDALVDAARQLTAAFRDEGFRQSVRDFGAMIGSLTQFVVEHGDKLVVLGGVIAGARTGASIGRIGGPKGAAIGAGVGALVGGIGVASILPDGTASGQDEKRVMDVEAAVARLKRRIDETRYTAASGLIKPQDAQARIAADEQRISKLTNKNAAPGAPNDLARHLARRQWDAYLGQFRSKSQQLKDALANLRQLANSAGIDVASDEFRRAEAAVRTRFAPKRTDANTKDAAARAAADAELALLKDGLKRQQTALDAALEDRLVSVRDYYAQKTALEQRELDAEIARAQQLLAQQNNVAQNADTESERIRAKAEVARIEADLIALNNRRADVEQANASAAARAERELAAALAQARAELAQITGTATDADRRARVEESYRDLRDRLLAESDTAGVALIDRLIDVKAAQLNLDALETAWRQAQERMRIAQDAARTAFDAGLITQDEYQRRVAESSQDAATALDALLPRMEAAASALGEDARLRVAGFGGELARLQTVVDPVAKALESDIKNAATTLFTDLSSGTKRASDAFRSFAQSVIASFKRIIAQRLAERIFGGLGGSGIVGAILKPIGLASGGYVTGPGTGTSDSIPARLSSGEYVVRAAAVRQVGVAFLDAINGLRVPPRVSAGALAFAAGGLVPEVRVQQPQLNQAVRVVNVVDPSLAADYLNSSAGERTILNILQRNAGAVRQVIA